jgi:hypothetical protein
LGIHVGVAIDKAGGDNMSFRIDDFIGAIGDSANCDDPSTGDADVGLVARKPGAIDHRAAADNDIVLHAYLLCREAWLPSRRYKTQSILSVIREESKSLTS